MKKTLFFFIILLCSFDGFSQEKSQKVKTLLTIMDENHTIDKIMNGFIVSFTSQSLIQKNDKKYFEYINFLTSESKKISNRVFYDEMPALYEKYFTVDEIEQYIKFYSTPAGKKLLENQPLIQNEIYKIMSVKDLPEFNKKIKEKLKEIKQSTN